MIGEALGGVRSVAGAVGRVGELSDALPRTVRGFERRFNETLGLLGQVADDLNVLRGSLIPAMGRIEDIESTLDATTQRIEAELAATRRDLNAARLDLAQVRARLDEAVDLLPGDDEPGPLERAKDALTPG